MPVTKSKSLYKIIHGTDPGREVDKVYWLKVQMELLRANEKNAEAITVLEAILKVKTARLQFLFISPDGIDRNGTFMYGAVRVKFYNRKEFYLHPVPKY